MFDRTGLEVHWAKRVIENPGNYDITDARINSSLVGGVSGATYFTIDKARHFPYPAGENLLEYIVCRLSINEDGCFSIKLVENLNDVPLEVLRQLHTYFSGCFCPMRENIAYDSSYTIWNFAEREEFEKFKAFEDFELVFHDRSEIMKQDFICDPKGCDMETITYRELRNFKCYQRFAPPPTAGFIRTYIPEGEFWVFYGGLISTKYVYQEALKYLENTPKFCNMTRDQISKTLNICLYLSDAVWKYFPAQDKWELALPATAFNYLANEVPPTRPHGTIVMTAHHPERKSIYYISRDFRNKSIDSLFEFDYEINKFTRIALNCTISKQVFGGAIDFSNDTFILSTTDNLNRPRLLVFCFRTHHIIWLKANYSCRICLMDNYKKLVFLRSGVLGKSKLEYIDWEKVEQKTLNPLLEKQRRILSQGEKEK